MTEIKFDKSTLPKEGDKVNFKVLKTEEWRVGLYGDEDEIFAVTTGEYYFAWEVSVWELI